MVRPADSVERRIVVEYGRQYAYLYVTDGEGKVLDDESFKQPYRLERKESHEEARKIATTCSTTG
jgi:translation elongation factor P/translation initiation factor 5A